MKRQGYDTPLVFTLDGKPLMAVSQFDDVPGLEAQLRKAVEEAGTEGVFIGVPLRGDEWRDVARSLEDGACDALARIVGGRRKAR